MRFGVIADIHGNLPALEAVLEEMPPVDGYLCAGDIVGYNPWPAACLDRVRALGAITVQGNHDRAVAETGGIGFNAMAMAGVDYARENLDSAGIEWLRSLPTRRRIAVEDGGENSDNAGETADGDGDILLVHGHPDDPDRYTYPDEFSASMIPEESRVVITGHTHVQGYREFDDGVVMNPGSVGQPRDGDPDAAFAVLEVETNAEGDVQTVQVDQRRVSYDIDRVIDAVNEVGLPSKIGTRLLRGQ